METALAKDAAMNVEAPVEAPLVLTERAGPVAVLRMNCPAMRNALTAAMRAALEAALDAANADPEVRALVIAGGSAAFCAGGDLSTMAGMTPDEARARILAAHQLPRRIHASAKPVVAAVEGVCAGAGLGVASGCDLVVAGQGARFLTAFERVGLMPDLGAGWSVTSRIGVQAARRLFLLGGAFDAAEAHRIGLCDALTEAGGAEAEAIALAHRLACNAPGALRAVRDLFRSPPVTLEDALAVEAEHQPGLYLSAELREGIAAFRERREPAWRKV